MGIFDQNATTLPSSSTVIADTQIPDWVSQAGQDNYLSARELANQDYTPYTGPRVAGLSDTEQQAKGTLQGAVGSWKGSLDQSNGALDQAGQALGNMQGYSVPYHGMVNSGFDMLTDPSQQNILNDATGQLDKSNQMASSASEGFATGGNMADYMSPYHQQVTDIAARELNRNFDVQKTQENASAANGAFGGSRHGIINAEGDRNRNLALGDLYAKGNQDAFTNAQGQFNNEQNRELQSAGLYGKNASARLGVYDRPLSTANQAFSGASTGFSGMDRDALASKSYNDLARTRGELGVSESRLGLQDSGALQNFGALERQNEQSSYDTAYNDYLEQREYPYRQLNFASGALSGVPYETRTTTNSSALNGQLGTSPAGQIAGVLGGAAGALKYFGNA